MNLGITVRDALQADKFALNMGINRLIKYLKINKNNSRCRFIFFNQVRTEKIEAIRPAKYYISIAVCKVAGVTQHARQ